MRKFSTKHGFTMAEVLVAFVIFAVMAGIVSSIISAAMRVKQNNLELEQQILDQKQAYYVDNNIGQAYDPAKAEGDKLTFNFDGIQSLEIDYNIAKPNAASTEGGLELEYFVGDVNYSKLSNAYILDENSDNDPEENTAPTLDTRLYGTAGINSIRMLVRKDLNYTEGNRYFFAVKTTAFKFNSEDLVVGDLGKYFVQCRLSFPGNSVKDCGYMEYRKYNNSFSNISSWRNSAGKRCGVMKISNSVVRISGKQIKDWSLPFGSDYVGIYVTLERPLEEVASGTELDGNVEIKLDDALTSIPKKTISNDIYKNISAGTGYFTVREALQWKDTIEQAIPFVEAAKNTNAGNEKVVETLEGNLDLLNTELSDITGALDDTEIYLSANRIFGYSDYDNTPTKSDDDFYYFHEYDMKPSDKDVNGDWIYETQTGVLGAFSFSTDEE